jgi:hypothetical protein
MTTTEVLMVVAYETKAAIAAERARCAAVCREVADGYDDGEARSVVARTCAEAIERWEGASR